MGWKNDSYFDGGKRYTCISSPQLLHRLWRPPATYAMATEVSFPDGKVAMA
jgi:hypothetical protein